MFKKIFLLHTKNLELMDVRIFNVRPVSHFVKAEPLDKIFFFYKKKVSAFLKANGVRHTDKINSHTKNLTK